MLAGYAVLVFERWPGVAYSIFSTRERRNGSINGDRKLVTKNYICKKPKRYGLSKRITCRV
jgi:hypothetical protein